MYLHFPSQFVKSFLYLLVFVFCWFFFHPKHLFSFLFFFSSFLHLALNADYQCLWSPQDWRIKPHLCGRKAKQYLQQDRSSLWLARWWWNRNERRLGRVLVQVSGILSNISPSAGIHLLPSKDYPKWPPSYPHECITAICFLGKNKVTIQIAQKYTKTIIQ